MLPCPVAIALSLYLFTGKQFKQFTHCLYFFNYPIFFTDSNLFSMPIIPRKRSQTSVLLTKCSGHLSFLSLFYLALLTIELAQELFFFWLWGCHFLLVFLLPLTVPSNYFFSRFSSFPGLLGIGVSQGHLFSFYLSPQMTSYCNFIYTYMLITLKFVSLSLAFWFSDSYIQLYTYLLYQEIGTTNLTCAQTQYLLSPKGPLLQCSCLINYTPPQLVLP